MGEGTVRVARAGRGRPTTKQRTQPHKRDRRSFVSLPLSEIDRTNSVTVLPITAPLIVELLARGYQTVDDLAALTALQAVHIPGMNGRHWQVIATALRRKQFPMSLAEK